MQAALLPHRGVVKVTGENARAWLGNLVTIDMGRVALGAPRFGALLTPQGKIIADFIVAEAEPGSAPTFFLDCSKASAPGLVQSLNRYKLRAKVMVEDISEVAGIMAVWDGQPKASFGLIYPDPRLPDLGLRCMVAPHRAEEAAKTMGATLADASAYESHRIALGVPQGGLDFTYGNAFPHETDMDQLGGVDFDKGCYIGQEVVSRVEHRATARARVVPVAFDGVPPETGGPVTAGDKQIGTLGSTAEGRGLALIRIDRAADAMAHGVPLQSGGVPIRLVKPDWAHFAWPGE